MKLEPIIWKVAPSSFPCFLCEEREAVYHATMKIDKAAKITVCLCQQCICIPEGNILACLMEVKKDDS